MRNSIEIAQYIEKLLNIKNMKPIELANKVGVDRSTISRYLNGSRKIPMDEIPKFASALDITPVELLIDNEELNKVTNIEPITSKVVKIPILGDIACGDPITAEQNIEGYTYDLADDLPSGNIFALVAKGDSMEPTIQNGSKVIVREQADVENGELAAVLLNGETEATLKRIRKQNGSIILSPDNNKYAPILVNEANPARIIGKIVRVIKDFI